MGSGRRCPRPFYPGLGTQVKGHNERRYSVKWEPPVPRLREYIGSLRAIFKCWAEGGAKLSFSGKYYDFSLMTPFFTPPKHAHREYSDLDRRRQRTHLRLAGETCDGLHAHPFNSPKYLREYVLPNVEARSQRSRGRARKDFTIASTRS